MITLTLTAALATTMMDIPTASAETNITETAATYTPLQLMEVKDGQLDEKGVAYFELTIPQEGYYKLVGTNVGNFQTAVSADAAKLENAPLQAASKLRVLNKGTYYVKVKGTPNEQYHFKFAERTFNLDKAWQQSTDTVTDGRDKRNYIDFPYYANRQVSATLKLTQDKHIRFYGANAKGVKALTLKNIDTGKSYTAKKISDRTFSSNAPDGTYAVSLVMTDEFIANPYVSKIGLRYTLGERLLLNDNVSTDDTPFNTFTLNVEKDTKITFTLTDPKGKMNFKRKFSIYNDKHQLVKRVHILAGQSSRTFTYTVKKGRYSVASSNMNIQTSTKSGADQGAFTLKNGLLVNKKTGKTVKGYQVYNEKLYKDGKLTTGHVKYGKVPNMKLYYNGALKKGIYITKDYQYAFKDGALMKGDYKYEGWHDAFYKDGVLTHLMELKDGATLLYDNGKLHQGRYIYNLYEDGLSKGDVELKLFINGKLATGYEEETYDGKTYLFKDGLAGATPPFYYNGKVYIDGKPRSGYVTVDGTLYYNHELFTGIRDERYYEKGIRQYYLVTKAYEDKVKEAVALKAQVGQQSDEAVAALLKEKVTEVFAYLDDYGKQEFIYDDYGHMQYDDVGEAGYENPLNIPQTIGKQLEEIDEVAKQLGDAGADTHALLEKRVKDIYLEFKLHYENGVLLDGEYEGNLYDKGKLLGAVLNLAYAETGRAPFLGVEYYNLVTQKDVPNIKAKLQTHVDAVTKRLQAADAIVKASQDPDYPKVNLYTDSATSNINESISDYRYIQNVMKMYDAQADLTELQQAMTEGFTLLGKIIDFNEPDPKADYQAIKLLDVQDGSFDDKGFAYFKVDVTEPVGNYEFVGNDDVASYTTFASTTPENIAQSQQLETAKLRYFEKGTHYIAVKGQPNQPYHFKLQRHTYNVETMTVLERNKKAEVPIYEKNQPSVKINLTTNQHVQFSVSASDTTDIDAIELTNQQTGKTYTASKWSTRIYTTFVPNGTYDVSIKSSSPAIGQHVSLSYNLSPTFTFNKTVSINEGLTRAFSFVVDKDTKTQFTLSSPYYSSVDQKFKLYNDKDELVKSVTLKEGNLSSRTFTYTVKKGNYYIRLNGSYINVTATPK